MRILLLLRGSAGCGKSTWIQNNGLKQYTLSADVEKDCVARRYHVTEGTPENPYHTWEQREGNNGYTNHYVIDNNGVVRYDWMAIEEVLAKYGIRWEYGDCD